MTYALYGGLSADASADYTNEVNKSSSYTNSHLNSSNINIRSNQDTNIQGAVVKAEDDLSLEVGGSLKVESLQNRKKNKSYTVGASASSSTEEGKTISGNLDYSMHDVRQTNRATIGSGTLVVKEGETNINRDIKAAQEITKDSKVEPVGISYTYKDDKAKEEELKKNMTV